MLRSLAVSFGLLFGALPTAGLAQSDWCYQQAAELCGPLSMGECFVNDSTWTMIPDVCHGDIQRQIEMDREFNQQQGGSGQQGGYLTGMAWGGKMRASPSINARQIGSLFEGEFVEIVGETGEWYNDFQWFELIAGGRQGFVWGGNFCHHHQDGFMDGSGGPC